MATDKVGRICADDVPGVNLMKRQAKVTVKYNRKELQKRMDVEKWIDDCLDELYLGKEDDMPDEVNIDDLLDLPGNEERVKKLQEILQTCIKKTENSNQQNRAVLLGLSHFLKENPSQFIKICKPTEENEAVKPMNIGILVVTEEEHQCPIPKEMIDIALILEEYFVLQDLKDVPNAFALLMGLLCLQHPLP